MLAAALQLVSLVALLAGRATGFSLSVPPTPSPIITARAFYDAWNQGDTAAASALLAPDVIFFDANNSEPFRGRRETSQYLADCTEALGGLQFVIDDWSEDLPRRRLGLMWHVTDAQSNPLPFPTKGVSFLKFDESGLILECTDIPEPTVKVGKLQLPLLGTVTKLLGLRA
ncbi:unnamed protein product [Chrysoparadoxa australica]